MEYRDFVYWLQGFFEVSGLNTLTKPQFDIVYKHLKMSLKYNENNKIQSPARDFSNWLDGVFSSQSDGLISLGCNEIIRRLNLVFKHEIDPSMPDPKNELSTIHQGFFPPFDPHNTTLRC